MEKIVKVVTQNCFFGRRVRQVINLIKESGADVFCLQELTSPKMADRIKRETGYDYLLSHPANKFLAKIFFYNAIFTKLPVLSSGELNWLNEKRKRLGRFMGKALWGVFQKKGKDFKVYSCHFSAFGQGFSERKRMITDIIRNSQNFQGPVIISGDMNTVIPDQGRMRWLVKLIHKVPSVPKSDLGNLYNKNEKYFFLKTAREFGFEEAADLDKNTWRLYPTRKELFGLKLDWMLYRNCQKISANLGGWIGDHKGIIGQLKLK